MFDFLRKQVYIAPLFVFFLFQDSEVTYSSPFGEVDWSMMWIPLAIALVLVIFFIACFWRVFEKAGQPGWASIIPIYNMIVLLKIVGKPWWWIFLLAIPIVNLIFSIIVCIELARYFGKGTGFGVGLVLLGFIFFPILAFGSARYMPHQQQFQPQPPYPPPYPPQYPPPPPPQYGGYR